MSIATEKEQRSRDFLATVRLYQIRTCAKLANLVAGRKLGRAGLSAFRRLPAGSRLLDAVLGHRRVYPTLSDAQTAIARYENRGHDNQANVDIHMDMSISARPSDYAALFHIQPVIEDIGTVYDVGGNAGNIYYCYRNYLRFRPDMRWIVYDLPGPLAYGRTFAAKEKATQLAFTDDWSQASGVDLMLISGSLHYFDEPLAARLRKLPEKPKYLLINRTPLTTRPTVGAVQDAGDFHVACLLLNRDELIQDLTRLGYELQDSWRCSELTFVVPANPDYNLGPYSGLMFRLT